MKKHTKQSITELLSRTDELGDRAICRALVALNKRQTVDERVTENTKHLNGRGFRPCHARMGTSMANQFVKFGNLTTKQLAYWRRPDKKGVPRIQIYASQLALVANGES